MSILRLKTIQVLKKKLRVRRKVITTQQRVNLSAIKNRLLLSLGVSICLDRVSIKTLNLDKKKADLDGRENLDTFKILVSTEKKNLLISTCRTFSTFSTVFKS